MLYFAGPELPVRSGFLCSILPDIIPLKDNKKLVCPIFKIRPNAPYKKIFERRAFQQIKKLPPQIFKKNNEENTDFTRESL